MPRRTPLNGVVECIECSAGPPGLDRALLLDRGKSATLYVPATSGQAIKFLWLFPCLRGAVRRGTCPPVDCWF